MKAEQGLSLAQDTGPTPQRRLQPSPRGQATPTWAAWQTIPWQARQPPPSRHS